MGAKESAVAKAKGPQDERGISPLDAALLQMMYQKIPKDEANYTIQDRSNDTTIHASNANST